MSCVAREAVPWDSTFESGPRGLLPVQAQGRLMVQPKAHSRKNPTAGQKSSSRGKG